MKHLSVAAAMLYGLFFPFCFLISSCNLEKIQEEGPTSGPLPTFETHFIVENGKDVRVESVVEALNGGYVISGTQLQHGFTNECNVFVVKVATNGTVEKRLFDLENFGLNTGGKLIRGTDAYYLIGTEYTSNYQVLVSKIKTDLTVAWTKTFGLPTQNEFGVDLAQTASGDLIAAASGVRDPFFLKIRSSDGIMLDSQTVNISNNGTFYPRSIVRSGANFGVMGYNFGISLPFAFMLKIDENLNTVIPYKALADIGNGSGDMVTDDADGFVVIDGESTQAERQAFITQLNGNGDKITRFDQFTDLPESGFLAGARSATGKYIACGWGAQVLGTDSHGIAALISSDLSTEKTYEYKSTGRFVEFTAAAPVSDGGYVIAGAYDNGQELMLVRLNDKLKLN